MTCFNISHFTKPYLKIKSTLIFRFSYIKILERKINLSVALVKKKISTEHIPILALPIPFVCSELLERNSKFE